MTTSRPRLLLGRRHPSEMLAAWREQAKLRDRQPASVGRLPAPRRLRVVPTPPPGHVPVEAVVDWMLERKDGES